MDWLKLVEALAWPLATIVVALVVLVVTRMIIAKNANVGLKFKDWFVFEANASRQIAEGVQADNEKPDLLDKHAIPALADADENKISSNELNLLDKPGVPAITEDSFSSFISAKSLDDLERAFAKFKGEKDASADLDFWTTYYIIQKRNYGAQGTIEELESAAQANPAWVHPLVTLLNMAVEGHDSEKAESLVRQLLARRTASSSETVLRAIANAYHSLYSPNKVLSFYEEMNTEGSSYSEKFTILSTLASSFGKSTNPFAFRTSLEMAFIADPTSKSDRFNLAYSYGEEDRLWTIAYYHYNKIFPNENDFKWSRNNLGVILEVIEKNLAIEAYMAGIEESVALSKSNLARMLIDDGYVGLAEKLISDIDDQQDAAEHIASTKAQALAARRVMTKRKDEISAFANEEYRKYTSILSQTYRMIGKGGASIKGVYADEYRSTMAYIDPAGVALKNSIGAIEYSGVLKVTPLGFDGIIRPSSESLLSRGISVSMYPTGEKELTVIYWPISKSTSDRVRVSKLTQIDEQPRMIEGKSSVM